MGLETENGTVVGLLLEPAETNGNVSPGCEMSGAIKCAGASHIAPSLIVPSRRRRNMKIVAKIATRRTRPPRAAPKNIGQVGDELSPVSTL